MLIRHRITRRGCWKVPLSQLFPRCGLFQSGAINFRSGRRAAWALCARCV